MISDVFKDIFKTSILNRNIAILNSCEFSYTHFIHLFTFAALLVTSMSYHACSEI